MFIRNKSVIKMVLTSKSWFQLKYESSVHNIAFSSEKVISSESGEKYAEIKHNLQVQTAKINMLVDIDVRGK